MTARRDVGRLVCLDMFEHARLLCGPSPPSKSTTPPSGDARRRSGLFLKFPTCACVRVCVSQWVQLD